MSVKKVWKLSLENRRFKHVIFKITWDYVSRCRTECTEKASIGSRRFDSTNNVTTRGLQYTSFFFIRLTISIFYLLSFILCIPWRWKSQFYIYSHIHLVSSFIFTSDPDWIRVNISSFKRKTPENKETGPIKKYWRWGEEKSRIKYWKTLDSLNRLNSWVSPEKEYGVLRTMNMTRGGRGWWRILETSIHL